MSQSTPVGKAGPTNKSAYSSFLGTIKGGKQSSMLANCQEYMKLSLVSPKNNLSRIPEEANSVDLESAARHSVYHARSPTGSQNSMQSHSKYVDQVLNILHKRNVLPDKSALSHSEARLLVKDLIRLQDVPEKSMPTSPESVNLTPEPKAGPRAQKNSSKLVTEEKKANLNKFEESRPSTRQISPHYEYQMGHRMSVNPDPESGRNSKSLLYRPLPKASTPALRELVHSASLRADIKVSPLVSARNKISFLMPNNSENSLQLKGVHQPFSRLFGKRYSFSKRGETSRSQIHEPSVSMSTGSHLQDSHKRNSLARVSQLNKRKQSYKVEMKNPVLEDIVTVNKTHHPFERVTSPLSERGTKRGRSQQVSVTHTSFLKFYQIEKLLGKGAFGKVALAYHKLTQKPVALKIIDKSALTSVQYRKVQTEIRLLSVMQHKNIIKLYEVLETKSEIYMVMEYAPGGDLLNFMKNRRSLPEAEARLIFKQIVNGVGHCHCRSVLHRDVKLDNILIDSQGNIKLCDFGISRVILDVKEPCFEQTGTPAYVAPEVMKETGYAGFKSDVWSLGVILFALVCGALPYRANTLPDLRNAIIKGTYKFPEMITQSTGNKKKAELSNQYKHLVGQLLETDPAKRITIPGILSHPWMADEDSWKLH